MVLDPVPSDGAVLTRTRSRTFPASDLRRLQDKHRDMESAQCGIDMEIYKNADDGSAAVVMRGKRLDFELATLTTNTKIISRSSVLVTDIAAGPPPYRERGRGALPQRVAVRPQVPAADEDAADALFLAGAGDQDSMRSATWLAVIIGQVFSLLPISANPTRVPRFRLLSFRVLYWALVFVGLILNALLAFINQTTDEAGSITGTSQWVFYLSASTISLLFFRLARRWRALCACFLRVERTDLPAEWGGNPAGTGPTLRKVTVLTLSLALAEYSLSEISSAFQMNLELYSLSNLDLFFRHRFMGNFRHLQRVISYSPLAFVVQQLLNVTATFMWNYNDLFVMLISLTIAKRFQRLNAKLRSDTSVERPESYWKCARESYNALSLLTREADDLLCAQILFSFMNNLYFICIQLLHTVKNERNSLLQNIYFTYSFGFLLARTVAVSLTAASINDQSKVVKKILYSVSSDSYCDEVDRFLTQVTSDEIALSGFKFFHVTRSVLLTMAGTIATYEVVMVQFSANNTSDP